MPAELDRMIDSLSEEDLKAIILALDERTPVKDLVEERVRNSLEFNVTEIALDVLRVIRLIDDYAYLESSMADREVSDLYSQDKASAAIAEAMFNEFYDKAEMMVDLGMMSEARAYIRAVSEGIRSCRDVESVMVAISDDFVVRYADNLESYLNTDDVLGGFGKKA